MSDRVTPFGVEDTLTIKLNFVSTQSKFSFLLDSRYLMGP